MYRLLIVDDEVIIVNGLNEIFNSMKDLDLDVYKAYSGDKAIQHNDVSYILKTEDPEKEINAVENAIKDIQNEIKIEDLIYMAKEQMNMALDLFQKDYFIHLLHEDPSLNITQSQFKQLEITMSSDKPVLLLLEHVDNIPTDLSYCSKIQYLYSVKLIIEQYLNTHITNVCVMDESYRFVLFIQPKELLNVGQIQTDTITGYEKTVSFLKEVLEVIQNVCRESLDVSISFALSGEPCRWEDVSKKYYFLSQLLNYRIGTGIEMLLIDNEIKNDILNTNSEVPELEAGTEALEMLIRQRRLDTFELYLESGQKNKFFKSLSELIDPLKLIKSKNSNVATEAYYKVSLILLSYINRYKLTDKIAFHLGQNRLMRIDMYESWEEAVEYIYQLSNVIFRLQCKEQKKRADNAIEYIQKFVEDHLSEDLSLGRLAEQVYLNPSYLSRLYKQVMGTNLSDFIDNARIKRAKELLEKENVKINGVAKMVGYETAASFTRFFRKITGCSPQEYHDAVLSSKHK